MFGDGIGPLLAVLLPLALGVAFLTRLGFGIRRDGVGVLAWAWLGGMLLVAILTFVALAARLPLGALPWGVAIAAGGLSVPRLLDRMRRRSAGRERSAADRGILVYAVGVVAALVPLLHRVLVTNATPALDGDAAFIWAAKAKLLYLEGGFTDGVGERLAFASKMLLDVDHADYPMLHPLNQVWFFASCGGIRLCDARLPSQLAGLAAVLATIGAVRRVAGRLLAVLIGVVVSAGLTHATAAGSGMSDGIVALGFVVAVDAACRHAECGEVRWWRLMIVALAAMLWTKNEGALLTLSLACGLVVAAVRGKVAWRALRPARAVEFGWCALLFVGPVITLWFTTRYGLANDLLRAPSSGKSFLAAVPERLAERGPTVIAWFTRHVLLDSESLSGLFGLWLVATFVFVRRAAAGTTCVVTTAVLAATVGIALVFIGTPHDLAWHLETAGIRVWSQSIGVVGLALGMLAGERRGHQRPPDPRMPHSASTSAGPGSSAAPR